MLRDHGQSEKYIHEVEGFNGRCDALQAALLRIKLKYLEKWNKLRRKNAELYLRSLKDIKEINLPTSYEDSLHVHHLFVIQMNNRDSVIKKLHENGIGSGLHYPIPLNLQKAYSYLGFKRGSFPIAEKAAERILSLPMYPSLKKTQIEYTCETLAKIIKK